MNLKNEIKESSGFLKIKMKKTLKWVTVAFFIICVVSGVVFYNDTTNAQLILQAFMNKVNVMTDGSGNIELLELFKNNLFACAISIGAGIIPFVFIPALTLASNGIIIGALLGYGEASGQFNAIKAVVFGMLPHGIFEIPALLISMSMGIYLCMNLSVKLVTRNKQIRLLEILNEITRVFVLIILPLIIIAALMECYVTPLILSFTGM